MINVSDITVTAYGLPSDARIKPFMRVILVLQMLRRRPLAGPLGRAPDHVRARLGA
jgi:hypothetical protein